MFDPILQWIAVGDAAMSFDPLSSQGMVTALESGVKCGQALSGCLETKEHLKMQKNVPWK
eukprot:TRINITY_DN8021_c0_g1_i1.p1 TRINITY_DN8021_c0_g1~~TRINITY_DN8021_c0_g1_i1.p1  ORF type:complete len:60 (-),score=20.65 TRINITY_DN8021_c0_g1_i1:65-244(-)